MRKNEKEQKTTFHSINANFDERESTQKNVHLYLKIRVSAVRFCPKPPSILKKSASFDALFDFGGSLACQKFILSLICYKLWIQDQLPSTT